MKIQNFIIKIQSAYLILIKLEQIIDDIAIEQFHWRFIFYASFTLQMYARN